MTSLKIFPCFLSEMDNLFNELSKLGETYTDEQKYNQLYILFNFNLLFIKLY